MQNAAAETASHMAASEGGARTLCPIWLRQSAAAKPAGPEPTTATFIPVR